MYLFLFNLPQFLTTLMIEASRDRLSTLSGPALAKLIITSIGIIKKIDEQRVTLRIEKMYNFKLLEAQPNLYNIHSRYTYSTWYTYVFMTLAEVAICLAAGCEDL